MEKYGEERLQRIILNETATILILCAFVSFGLFGYLNIYAIILETFLLLVSVLILAVSNLNGHIKSRILYQQAFLYSVMILVDLAIAMAIPGTAMKIILEALATASLLFVSYEFYKNPTMYDFLKDRAPIVRPVYIIIAVAFLIAVSAISVIFVFEPTDEFLIDLYSAMKFLHGFNPYNPAVTEGVFSYFKTFNLDLNVTPTMSGKDITLQGYPALAFLIYIPYVYIGKFANIIISIISFIPFILVYLKFRDKNIALYAMLSILLNVIFLYSAAFSLIGLVWVVFLMASYYLRQKPVYSGLFFGLSLSAKQFPAFMFPFMFYMIYRENGLKEAVKWTVSAFILFMTINGYFIARSPVLYFRDIMSSETMGLIGIGFGPSQLSFLNLIHIPPDFFTALLITSFLFLLSMYIVHYDTLKFTLFVFPLFIMIFNYRLLITYVAFWPIISVISIEDIDYKRKLRIDKRALKRYAVYAVAVLIAVMVIGAYYNSTAHDPVRIDSVHMVLNHGNASGIMVNVTYTGSAPEALYFRGIINETNYNGLLFNYSGNVINNGKSTIMLYPVRGEVIPDNTTLDLIAYNGTIQGSAAYRVTNWNVTAYHDLLYNPPQNRLSLSQSLP
ncbi:MAG: hypothetical protein RE471_08605 [Ferroplasma sp.]|uniref:hypothetical protein n=1 Tax=Ferroplasma sp. TaxID=2591003 RepID=UPI002815359D|nr:hypothetical protein [Ferroplasma sp.]WMT51025.1 MAG: hypothetical protein RE471_08605 [Ferroplasma sp.]